MDDMHHRIPAAEDDDRKQREWAEKLRMRPERGRALIDRAKRQWEASYASLLLVLKK